VPVTFVGHPLLELTDNPAPRDVFLRGHGLDPARPVVAILPGSRRNELRAILPDLVRAAGIIAARLPSAQFVLARAPHLDDELFRAARRLARTGVEAAIVIGRFDRRRPAGRRCSARRVGHGDRAGGVTWVPDGRRLSRGTDHLPDRQAARARGHLCDGQSRRRTRVVPELIQDAFTPESAAAEALRVLTEPAHAATVKANLAAVRTKLGTTGASRRAG